MLFCNKENNYVMCSNCCDFIKHKYAFYATYKSGGIILCKDCAEELYSDLKNFLDIKED